VMQQVAMVLWKKFEQLEVKDDFRKWAFGVARYEALAWSRDKSRDRLVLAEDVLVTLADESLATEPALSAQRDALDGCLEKLAAEHRRMILDAYSPGVRIQAVASRSQRSVAGFYQWLHRIRLQLLDCVKRNMAVEGVS
jgi:RNA polymerase sigma-70 factor, ECF subfamily